MDTGFGKLARIGVHRYRSNREGLTDIHNLLALIGRQLAEEFKLPDLVLEHDPENPENFVSCEGEKGRLVLTYQGHFSVGLAGMDLPGDFGALGSLAGTSFENSTDLAGLLTALFQSAEFGAKMNRILERAGERKEENS